MSIDVMNENDIPQKKRQETVDILLETIMNANYLALLANIVIYKAL